MKCSQLDYKSTGCLSSMFSVQGLSCPPLSQASASYGLFSLLTKVKTQLQGSVCWGCSANLQWLEDLWRSLPVFHQGMKSNYYNECNLACVSLPEKLFQGRSAICPFLSDEHCNLTLSWVLGFGYLASESIHRGLWSRIFLSFLRS